VGAGDRWNTDGTDDHDGGKQDDRVEDGRAACVHAEYSRSSVIRVDLRVSDVISTPEPSRTDRLTTGTAVDGVS
jgi:hypothetical protein